MPVSTAGQAGALGEHGLGSYRGLLPSLHFQPYLLTLQLQLDQPYNGNQSLVVQWLGQHISAERGLGSIPGQDPACRGQKIKKKLQKTKVLGPGPGA